MKQFSTEQEAFWAGEFGDAYVARNRGAACIASNVALFSRALRGASGVRSVIEFGANIGLNLFAFKVILPSATLTAVEINAAAVAELAVIPDVTVCHTSLLDYGGKDEYDLALIKGVLIHINPDRLPEAYDVIYRASRRYVLVAEYYNPTPLEIPYRGHDGKLFKRDFAGEMMARYSDLRLVDYGFVYHADPVFPQDDLTWFLLEKSGRVETC